jgi:hypothetical protein
VSQVQPRAIAPESLAGLLADLFAEAVGAGRLRVAIDGARPACPGQLADTLVGPLRQRGVEALRVRAEDFLRPASLRYEHGRTDPDSFYQSWLDTGALQREVLGPLAPGGSGRWLPSLWDPVTDRATRAPYEQAGQRTVLLVDGAFLLGAGLAFDLTVHLHLSPAALARRTPPEDQWTLPAHARYAEEAAPTEVADVVVRMDDPRHPAITL